MTTNNGQRTTNNTSEATPLRDAADTTLHRYNERRCADDAPQILIPRWLGCAEALEPKQCHFLLAVDGEIQAGIMTRSLEWGV